MDKTVWLIEERTFARLIAVHAHYSVVELADEWFNKYEMEVLNDDYVDWEGDELDE